MHSHLNKHAPRDLRIDFLRGLALLIIFSDHVSGSPIRKFMPTSLGFSDMAEVFVFLSGYLNGIVNRPAKTHAQFLQQMVKAIRRCLLIYVAILVVHVLTYMMYAGVEVFHIQGVRPITSLFLPINVQPDPWNIITLQCLIGKVNVLALYLPLLIFVPFVAELLRRYFVETLTASCQIHVAVQLWPDIVSLPQPWATSFFFNPLAWQFLFVLGMACSIRPAPCKAFISKKTPVFMLALVFLIASCLMRINYSASLLPGVWKHTLGPLRLIHFYWMLVVGRKLLHKDASFLTSSFVYPITLCGRHPLIVYCTGALSAIVGELSLTKQGISLVWIVIVNGLGWAACMLSAFVACWSKPKV